MAEAKARRRRKRKLPKSRDLFFGLIATLILFNELFLREEIRPIAAFLALWFYGMIPVAWADDARRAAASWLVPGAAPATTPNGDTPPEGTDAS